MSDDFIGELDFPDYHLQIFPQKGLPIPGVRRKWRYRLVHRNTNVLLTSQGYNQYNEAKERAFKLGSELGLAVEEVKA